MVDKSNMPHPKCLGSQKNPGTEPKTCEKGPKLGFEYLPTSKTSHCVRTACMAFPNKKTVGSFIGAHFLHAQEKSWMLVPSVLFVSLLGELSKIKPSLDSPKPANLSSQVTKQQEEGA